MPLDPVRLIDQPLPQTGVQVDEDVSQIVVPLPAQSQQSVAAQRGHMIKIRPERNLPQHLQRDRVDLRDRASPSHSPG